MPRTWTPPISLPAKLWRSLRSDLFPAAFGSVRQAGSHRFDLVNLPGPDLENLPHLHIRSSAVHVQHVDARNAFDLDLTDRTAMLEHRKRINQPFLFVDQAEPPRP